jgi:hypothetical protein
MQDFVIPLIKQQLFRFLSRYFDSNRIDVGYFFILLWFAHVLKL